jgi:hypothetical protein
MRFSRLLAPLLVLLFVVQAAHGDKSHPVTLTRMSPNTPQGMEGGFWRTDGHLTPFCA